MCDETQKSEGYLYQIFSKTGSKTFSGNNFFKTGSDSTKKYKSPGTGTSHSGSHGLSYVSKLKVLDSVRDGTGRDRFQDFWYQTFLIPRPRLSLIPIFSDTRSGTIKENEKVPGTGPGRHTLPGGFGG